MPANDNLIPVDPSAARAVILTGLRYLAVLGAGFTSLLGLIKRGNLDALIAYFQSDDALVFITTLITVSTIGWGLYSRYISHREKARAADPRDPAQLVLKQ